MRVSMMGNAGGAETDGGGFRKYIPLAFLIGFGFFTVGLMDPLYDSYVQIFLSRYISKKTVVGMIMALDNVCALLLIPLVSVWSDHTRTPLGRRMPWILVLLPLSAVFFAFIPYAAGRSFCTLLATLVILNIFKQSARGPIVALMPDVIPAEFRSPANGVINTMGNIAAIVGTIFLARLMDVDVTLPFIGETKDKLAFPVAGVVVLFATACLALFVREPSASQTETEKKPPFFKSLRTVFAAKDKSAVFILVSLFLWFTAYQGVAPYLAEYTIGAFHLTSGQGPISMGMVGIAGALAAVPAGWLALKIGRKRIIRVSLTVVSLVMVSAAFVEPVGAFAGVPPSVLKWVFWGLLFAFGVFWIAVAANSFPMLWQMADFSMIGAYTGLYYTFSQLAAVVAPAVAGAVIDVAGIRSMFLFAAFFFACSCAVMGAVKGGEKNDAPI